MDYLPIGSVVALDDVKLTVIGYYPKSKTQNTSAEYLGLIFPLGIDRENTMMMFNSEDIVSVLHKGYEDEDFIEYAQTLSDSRLFVEELNKKLNENEV